MANITVRCYLSINKREGADLMTQYRTTNQYADFVSKLPKFIQTMTT